MMRCRLSSSALSSSARFRKLLLSKPSTFPGAEGKLLLPRFFSASSTPTDDFTAKVTNFGGAVTDFDNNEGFQAPDPSLFLDSMRPDITSPIDETIVSAVPADVADIAVAVVQELGNHPTHLIMRLIENIHVTAGLPYWETIVVTTIALR